MAQIDCTLNSLMIPALQGFTPSYGTKKPSGGLRTSEVNSNVLLPFAKQRPFVITENSITSAIEADCRFVFTASSVTLALGDPVFAGCEVVVVNGATSNVTVSFSGKSFILASGDKAELISNAAGWIATQTALSTPTANRIALYDASGRLKSGAAPSANDDVVRKTELDTVMTAAEAADSELQANINALDSAKVSKNGTDSLMSAAEHTKLAGIAAGAQLNPGNATQSAAGLMSAADKKKLDEYFDLEHPVGSLFEQLPTESSPNERGWPGSWVDWSQKASFYAIAKTSPTAAFISDWRSIREDVWLLNTNGTVATSGTKKYSKPSGYVIVDRQTLQSNWQAADLAEQASLTYNGSTYYIWQVIAFAGTFFGVDDAGYTGGGKRPTFGSGGKQPDRIRDITGEASQWINTGLMGATSGTEGKVSGAFKQGAYYSTRSPTNSTSETSYGLAFASSGSVLTGLDNAPVNTAVRLWRRTT